MAVDSNGNQWYQQVAGLGSVGAYQSSGIPFVSGSIPVSGSEVTVVSFPQITKNITVKNLTLSPLRVGFSENGVKGTNHFILGYYEFFSIDLRVSKVFLKTDGDNKETTATIIAGLTTIPADSLPYNWSGSSGIG